MPVRKAAYQVLLGSMRADWSCGSPTFTLQMEGTTLSGHFDWVCTGAPAPNAFSCTTLGYAGGFRMKLRLVAVETQSNPPYWYYTRYGGDYSATIT